MIKVCQVVTDTNIGGAGRYLLNYLKHYDRNNYKVSVVIPKMSSLLEFVAQYTEVDIYEIPYMADKSYDTRCVKVLTELFKKEKFDIIHTHASLSARIAGRKAGIKTVISTRHCIEPVGKFLVSAIKGILNNSLCDYYIAVSDAVADNLKECCIKRRKIKKICNGVEAVPEISFERKEEIRKKYGIEGKKVFAIFARLEEVKGHKYFIDAAKDYLEKYDDAVFLIVGDGSLCDELRARAKDIPEIIFCGYVKDTTELLNITDVNVISSQSEAMSLAILEAMSLGKPTVATNVGGNPQLIKSYTNGILVDYEDYFGMSSAFAKMSQDEEFYNMASHCAKNEFYEKYTAQIMVKNLEELYQEVTNEHK